MPADNRMAPGRRDAGKPSSRVDPTLASTHDSPECVRSHRNDAPADHRASFTARLDAANGLASIVFRALVALAILVTGGWQGGFGLVAAREAARPAPGAYATDSRPSAVADLAFDIGDARPPRNGAATPDFPAARAPLFAARPASASPPIDGASGDAPRLTADGPSLRDAGLLGIDSDGDRLPDVAEHALGTDPLNGDFDADGLSDGDEVFRYGTDPRNSDTDGDGLPDGDEVLFFGTNPLGSDTNRDGLGTAEALTFVTGVLRLWDVVRVDASGARLLPHGGADP